jgi:hypothetical protein
MFLIARRHIFRLSCAVDENASNDYAQSRVLDTAAPISSFLMIADQSEAYRHLTET